MYRSSRRAVCEAPLRRLRQILAIGLGLLVATSIGGVGRVVADESSSELAAGGLVLVRTDSVAVEREDLTISPTEIRVRYGMRNDTGRPVQLRVAFPMPDVPRHTLAGLSSETADNVAMPPVTNPNFLDFRVWADEREVSPELEVHAVLPDGRDVTEAVRAAGGMSLLLHPGTFEKEGKAAASGGGIGRQLDAATLGKLEAIGALEQDDDIYDLRWTTHITFHWMQVFHPGVTVLEQSYRPVIGEHIVEVQPDAPLDRREKQRYCIDPSTERAIRSKAMRSRLNAFTVGYILQTAKNWRGPIGTFHLTLEGDEVKFADGSSTAVRLMSLCTDLPLRQTGRMRFEGTMKDYAPAYDLLMLVLTD